MAHEVEIQPAIQDWSPQERESFFAAIERHRRAAWQVTAISRLCALIVALVIATLMSPLLYGLIGIALDVVNWVIRTPDLIKTVTTTIGDVIDHPGDVTLGRAFYLGSLAALPGLAVMALLLRTLARVMGEAMAPEAGDLEARAPRTTELNEQRFFNVVSEMALAASVPTPRMLVTESESANAAAFGRSDGEATIVVTTGLLATLNRAELQAVAAHLVGSVADGDMKIGTRIATLLGLFGLIARLSGSFADREAARRFARLLRASLESGANRADGELAIALANPFEDEGTRRHEDDSNTSDKVPWRTWAWMPLAGPLVISGFFGGMVSTMLLGPLLALTWRRRKYMADATAVRLTRDPDALATALQKMSGTAVHGAFSAWTSHMSVVPSSGPRSQSLFSGSAVAMAPSYERRLLALRKMGAQLSIVPRRQIKLVTVLVLAPIVALVASLMGVALFLLVYISIALSGFFTWLPAILLHAILR
jgi:Zn-dependent protease with chaperone function